jgi:hypothetical protein
VLKLEIVISSILGFMHSSSYPGVQHGGVSGFIPQLSIGGGVSVIVPTSVFSSSSSLLLLDVS